MAWLDYDGLLYFWQKIKAKLADKVDKVDGKGLSTNDFSAAYKAKLDDIANGANNYSHPTSSGNKHIPAGGSAGQILRWSSDGTAQWGNDNNTTYSAFKGATSSAAGGSGLVPAPAATNATQYLRGDGTWATPPDTKYNNASTSSAGLMSSGDKAKLDGIAANANNYAHPTSAGNKHIPAGGSAGQILRWSADGTAQWGNDNNTTYSDMKGATTEAAGVHGLAPAPAAGAANRYLRSDGTWQTPPDTNTTYGTFKAATASAAGGSGLVPAPAAGKQGQYLRGDGTWSTSDSTSDSLSAAQGKALKGLVDGKASSEHTHGLNSSSLTKSVDNATTNSWDMVGGNKSFLLRSLRMQSKAPDWLEGNYAAGIAFGGSDTKGVISHAYSYPSIKFAGGNGAAPVWWLRLTGTSGKSYDLNAMPPASHTHSFSSITDKPSTYTPSAHNQSWSTITDKPALMESGDYSAETIEALLKRVQGLSPRMGSCCLTKDTHVANTWWNFIYTPHRTGSGDDNPEYGTLLLFPMVGAGSSYIVRAVKDGIVREVRKIYTSGDKPTKGDVGLGNVDNTADANKSVKYATSAGSAAKATTAGTADKANSVDWSKVQNKPSFYPPSSHSHAYLPLGGGTISGQIKRDVGCSWIYDRDNAIVYGTSSGTSTGYHPVIGQKTPSGAWTIGTYSDERLIFDYTTDANKTAGTNNGTQVYLPAQAGTIITSATIGSQSVNYANSAGNATNATTATKLSSNAGSSVQPVYFSGGKPVAIGYTISSSVPANAKFTDTTYGVASSSSNGLMSSTDKTKLDDFSRVISIQKQIKLTTDWLDTGIAGNSLDTGTYVVQVSGFNSSYTQLYSEIYSGVMSWYSGTTNSGNSSEIFLHNAGLADNNNAIYLRTLRVAGSKTLKLQIACKVAATGTDILTFKFRRLI